jgi:hypothetical protein
MGWWIVKDVEKDGDGLFEDTVSAFGWGDWDKPRESSKQPACWSKIELWTSWTRSRIYTAEPWRSVGWDVTYFGTKIMLRSSSSFSSGMSLNRIQTPVSLSCARKFWPRFSLGDDSSWVKQLYINSISLRFSKVFGIVNILGPVSSAWRRILEFDDQVTRSVFVSKFSGHKWRKNCRCSYLQNQSLLRRAPRNSRQQVRHWQVSWTPNLKPCTAPTVVLPGVGRVQVRSTHAEQLPIVDR